MGIRGPASVASGAVVGGLIGLGLVAVVVVVGIRALDWWGFGDRGFVALLILAALVIVLGPASVVLGAILGAGRAATRDRATPAPPDTWTVPDASAVEEALGHHPVEGPGAEGG